MEFRKMAVAKTRAACCENGFSKIKSACCENGKWQSWKNAVPKIGAPCCENGILRHQRTPPGSSPAVLHPSFPLPFIRLASYDI